MPLTTMSSHDATAVLRQVGAFLESRPERGNLLLSLLSERARSNEAGTYWTVNRGGSVVGLLFHSPHSYPALLSPMPATAARVLAWALAGSGSELPGVNGEAATAAAFAGAWTEAHGCSAVPQQGVRLYGLGRLKAPKAARGSLRTATDADRELVQRWYDGFAADLEQPTTTFERLANRRTIHLWEVDGVPMSMVAATDPEAGVCRIGPVYTPPELRRQGHAAAAVAAVSARLTAQGNRCVLYTDLGNATANSVYRRIGYRALAESLRYTFTG